MQTKKIEKRFISIKIVETLFFCCEEIMPRTNYLTFFYNVLFILFLLLPYASTRTSLNVATTESREMVGPFINTIIVVFVLSTIISLATCIMLWYTFFYLYANVYRIMWSLEEKLRIATRRFSDRKLGDDIMAQIRLMAPYDATRNNQEIRYANFI